MWRSRAVGSRRTPRASATSWPCAQVSISRAVAIDGTLIGGPYQGTRVPGAAARRAASSAAWSARHPASSAAVGCAAPASAPSSTKVNGRAAASARWASKAAGSVRAVSAARSVQARWAIWCATAHPSAGVAAFHSASLNSATSASSSLLSAARSSSTGRGSDTARSSRARRAVRRGRSMAAREETSKRACRFFAGQPRRTGHSALRDHPLADSVVAPPCPPALGSLGLTTGPADHRTGPAPARG